MTAHNLSYHPLYSIWNKIKGRCCNINHQDYKYYGGRGIIISDEWINNPQSFIEYCLKNGWREGLTIDRINNDGNYEKFNIRFVNRLIQANNVRTNKIIIAFGESKTLADWSRDIRCKIKYGTLKGRINDGWNPEEAISTSASPSNRKKNRT